MSETSYAAEHAAVAGDTALIIMARYPSPGQTKTRLAVTLGDQETATLYRAFLTDLAQRFAVRNSTCTYTYTLHWAYTPAYADYAGLVSELVPTDRALHPMVCFPQQGEDFGACLLNAFQWSAAHGFQHTILVSSDTPHLSLALIDQAHHALKRADVVLGPADDGGYYLIAMRHPHDVFSGIPMSTADVLRLTIASARQQALSVELLPSLFDIDEQADLLRLASLLEHDPTLAPVTANYLKTIDLKRNAYVR